MRACIYIPFSLIITYVRDESLIAHTNRDADNAPWFWGRGGEGERYGRVIDTLPCLRAAGVASLEMGGKVGRWEGGKVGRGGLSVVGAVVGAVTEDRSRLGGED